MCSFSLAVNRRRKVEGQPDVDFFRVTCMNKIAELVMQYLKKGRKVCVSGSLTLSTFTGQDGIQRTSPDVFADDIEFLYNAPRDNAEGGSGYYGQSPTAAPGAPKPPTPNQSYTGYAEMDEDELPF
jgi:single stranded DNA-binding protein